VFIGFKGAKFGGVPHMEAWNSDLYFVPSEPYQMCNQLRREAWTEMVFKEGKSTEDTTN
jgi:hypothetical protein